MTPANRSASASLAPDTIDGVITLGITLIDILAFDDITTDVGAALLSEWSFLALSALWAMVLAARLFRRGDAMHALSALGLLALALFGKRGIGPGTMPALEVHYLAETGAMIGFAILGLRLIVRGTRDHHRRVEFERAGVQGATE